MVRSTTQRRHIESRTERDAWIQTVQERRNHDFRHRVDASHSQGQFDLAKLVLKDATATAVWNAVLSAR